jgi:hypothetical protein
MNINNKLYINELGNLTSYGTIASIGMIDGTTYSYKTEIDGGKLTTASLYVRPLSTITGEFSPNSSGYVQLNPLQISTTPNGAITGFMADIFGYVTCNFINGGTPITAANYDSGTYAFPPSVHYHSEYASSSHSHSISDVSGLSSILSSLESRISALE